MGNKNVGWKQELRFIVLVTLIIAFIVCLLFTLFPGQFAPNPEMLRPTSWILFAILALVMVR